MTSVEIVKTLPLTFQSLSLKSLFYLEEWIGDTDKRVIIESWAEIFSNTQSHAIIIVPIGDSVSFGGSLTLENRGTVSGTGGAPNGGTGGNAIWANTRGASGQLITIQNSGILRAGGGGGGKGGKGGKGNRPKFVQNPKTLQYVEQDDISTGGLGGNGGTGAGTTTGQTNGSLGTVVPSPAGHGGRGGMGGFWGSPGASGVVGSNGNYTNGTPGKVGGFAGYYLKGSANVVFENTGTVLGETDVTWNPSAKSSNIVLSEDNLTALNTISSIGTVRANISKATGKWYFETVFEDIGNSITPAVGVSMSSTGLLDNSNTPGSATIRRYGSGSRIYDGAGDYHTGYPEIYEGDIIGVAFDTTTRSVWFSINGSWQNGSPSTGKHGHSVTGTGPLFPICAPGPIPGAATGRFHPSSLAYPVPKGFAALT